MEPGEASYVTGSIGTFQNIPFFSDYPRLAQPVVHNLMRKPLESLTDQIIRSMVEGSFFEEFPELLDLLPAACFCNVGIWDQGTFLDIWKDVYENGRFHILGKEFSYEEYLNDIVDLLEIVDLLIPYYFFDLPWVEKAIQNSCEPFDQNEVDKKLKTIWKRFLLAFNKELTAKQKNVMRLLHMIPEPLSLRDTAVRLQRSFDSIRDRAAPAKKKLRNSVPELLSLKRQKITTSDKPILYNGLYRKDGEKIRPLFRVDVGSGTKTRINHREGKPLRRKNSISLNAARAWGISETPIPDLICTDYFCSLYPELEIIRAKGESYYEGHGVSLQKRKHLPSLGNDPFSQDNEGEEFPITVGFDDLLHEDFDVPSAGLLRENSEEAEEAE